MAANCFVSKWANLIILRDKFAIKPTKEDKETLYIMKAYLNELECNIKNAFCLPSQEPCSSYSYYVCKFRVYTISRTIVGSNIQFAVPILTEGVDPYQYSWDYDEDVFTLVSTTTSPILEVTYIDEPPTNLDTIISVTIMDSMGCIAHRTCHFIKQGSTTSMSC